MKIERPKLSWLERLYFPSLLKGLWTTLKHIPRRKVTVQYPERVNRLQGAYRGVPVLVRDPEGRVKCVACQLCEFVCPPKAIRVTSGSRPETAPDAAVEKEPEEFTIDMLRCIYCGLCQEVCPEEAIFLMKDYSLTGYSRQEMVFNLEKLLARGGVHQDNIQKWKHK